MMENTKKKAAESLAIQTKMVLPNDTNPLKHTFLGEDYWNGWTKF